MLRVPSFPYQAYLDSMGEDEYFPTIGDDGGGFAAISNNIRYPEMPDTLALSHFADSLLQLYNIAIAFNTVAYDVSTAERYIDEADFGLEQADALDSINISGIHYPEIKEALVKLSRKAAQWIRSGKKPNEQRNVEVEEFYEVFNAFRNPLFDAHLSDIEFKPSEILEDSPVFILWLFQTPLLSEANYSNKCFESQILIRNVCLQENLPMRTTRVLIGMTRSLLL